MTPLKLRSLSSCFDDYDAFLFDLWGVIVEGATIYNGAVHGINQVINAGKKCLFVSNAPRPAKVSAAMIKSWGINTSDEMVFTSGEVALNLMRKYNKIFHLGKDRNSDIFADFPGKESTDPNESEAALFSIYRDEGEDLNEFDDLIKIVSEKKMPIICANPDTIIPNGDKLRYCAGYFAQKAKDLGAEVIYTGKPYREIFNQALAQISEIPKDRVLMIGDTLEMDILGANNAGIDSALVMTGNAGRLYHRALSLEESLEIITKVSNDLGAMPNFAIDVTK